jgi:aerobic C4-dicarboxylate transport protein
MAATAAPARPAKGGGSKLYIWVLAAIAVGIVIGAVWPATGVALRPLGDGFIALVKMLIPPIIFCTVVLGIGGAGDMKKVGRVGVKALVYFEAVTTLALIIGLIVVNTVRPGAGFNVDPATLDASAVSGFAASAADQTLVDFFLDIVPTTFADAFTAGGSLLQVLFAAILFGYALTKLGKHGGTIHRFVEEAAHVFFAMMNAIMKLAPIGAAGAMAFTIGRYGLESLKPLAALMATYYITTILFVVLVLGPICAWAGFNLFRFILYIKDELLTVLGTASSESALVPVMQKLEKLGCSRAVVGLVIPSGMSFNMDGTSIYITMSAIFIAQAVNIDLSIGQQITLLLVAMLTSKGAAGIVGAGFVTLAATLAVLPMIPVAGLALILGVDRFMAESRSLTNFIGNGVATLVVSRWEGELDVDNLNDELRGGPDRLKPPRSLDRPEAIIEEPVSVGKD